MEMNTIPENVLNREQILREILRIETSWESSRKKEQSKPENELQSPEVISFPEDYFSHDNKDESQWAKIRNARLRRIIETSYEGVIWEIGAGSGRVAEYLSSEGIPVICVEPFQQNCAAMTSKNLFVLNHTLESLQLPARSIESIAMFDVIEHIEDDLKFIAKANEVLKPGGQIFISVPAHQFLFSERDLELGHYRRYSKKQLESLLIRGGFEVTRSEYAFSFLVLPAFLIRKVVPKIRKRRESGKQSSTNKIQNRLLRQFGFLLKVSDFFERKFGAFFGLSIFLVGRKA